MDVKSEEQSLIILKHYIAFRFHKAGLIGNSFPCAGLQDRNGGNLYVLALFL